MSVEGGVEELLAERPDLKTPLQEVLTVDENEDRWSFEDVPVESGPFGEFVNHGVVERVDNHYRLTDQTAVREAVRTDSKPDAPSESSSSLETLLGSGRPFSAIESGTVWYIAGALALVAAIRTIPVTGIYRNGSLVLSGNDPYYYRYWVEQTIDGEFSAHLTEMGEPLLVTTLATVRELLGGSVAVASHILVWYPVIAALIGALIVYSLAMTVSQDRRIALAAVLFFAVLPGHALRTSVGFADHHAFDYIWLGLTVLVVTKIAANEDRTLRNRTPWLLASAGAVSVAAQVLAWEGAPLLLVPLALIIPARALLDVQNGRSPAPDGLPLLAMLFVGAAFAGLVHVATGMQPSIVVVLSPLVLGLGTAFSLAAAIGWHQRGWNTSTLLVSYGLLTLVGIIVLINSPAPMRAEVFDRIMALFQGGSIVETRGMLNFESLGILNRFGFAFLIALPAMIAALGRSAADSRWLPLTLYAWFFTLLSIMQIRFVGEVATFVAVFAGCSFVWIAARLDATTLDHWTGDGRSRLGIPDRRSLATIAVLFVVLGGYGAVQSVDVSNDLAVENDVYDTATALAAIDADRGHDYPENYVLSDWSDNRIHNYFVNGHAESYLYAQDNYIRFAGGTNADSWYDTFENRVGYVVLAPAKAGTNPHSTIWRLTRQYGSAKDGISGLRHYRVVYVAPESSRVAVEVVPGATLTGTAAPGANVTVTTSVDRPTVDFEYKRHARADENGNWLVGVANPGRYTVTIGNQSQTVVVSEDAVLTGETIGSD